VTDDTPAHQRRRKPSKGDWIAVLLKQARCPDCGEVLGDKANCEFEHDIGLADRWDAERWVGVEPNDPRFATIRHVDCHKVKTAKETTVRSKTKRIGRKHADHREKMRKFDLPEPSAPPAKRSWPKRSFPKRRKRAR